MTQMSELPVSMTQVNASFVPSADQLGRPVGPDRMRSGSEWPAASTTYKFSWPSRSLTKAIFEPSGDQAGNVSRAGWFVRLRAALPRGMSSTMISPSRSNASWPSGDQDGARSAGLPVLPPG